MVLPAEGELFGELCPQVFGFWGSTRFSHFFPSASEKLRRAIETLHQSLRLPPHLGARRHCTHKKRLDGALKNGAKWVNAKVFLF